MLVCTIGNFVTTAMVAYLLGAASAGFVGAMSVAAVNRHKARRARK